jgi:hypothetical protein
MGALHRNSSTNELEHGTAAISTLLESKKSQSGRAMPQPDQSPS